MQVDPNNSEEALLLDSLKDMLPDRMGSPPSIVFHGIDGKNMQEPDSYSWFNQEEASQVYLYLLDLYNRGLRPDDIGIITPYAKQVRITLLMKLKHYFPSFFIKFIHAYNVHVRMILGS